MLKILLILLLTGKKVPTRRIRMIALLYYMLLLVVLPMNARLNNSRTIPGTVALKVPVSPGFQRHGGFPPDMCVNTWD